nr:MAG TPA: hypothetical protein [Caudoviricetes sp.]
MKLLIGLERMPNCVSVGRANLNVVILLDCGL